MRRVILHDQKVNPGCSRPFVIPIEIYLIRSSNRGFGLVMFRIYLPGFRPRLHGYGRTFTTTGPPTEGCLFLPFPPFLSLGSSCQCKKVSSRFSASILERSFITENLNSGPCHKTETRAPRGYHEKSQPGVLLFRPGSECKHPDFYISPRCHILRSVLRV